MNIAPKPKLKKFIDAQVREGRYKSVDDALSAAMARLMQDDQEMDFAPGELQRMVDEGEADIARGDVLTIKQVRQHFARRLKKNVKMFRGADPTSSVIIYNSR